MSGSKLTNRLMVAGAAALAGALIAAPTVLGLRGNSSFTRDIPVPVPSGAHPAVFNEPEPSGGRTTMDDHPGHDGPTHDINDDHGGLRDDRDGDAGSSSGPDLRDDATHDRTGRRASDDGTGSDDRTGRRGSDDITGRHGSDDLGGDRHGGRGDG